MSESTFVGATWWLKCVQLAFEDEGMTHLNDSRIGGDKGLFSRNTAIETEDGKAEEEREHFADVKCMSSDDENVKFESVQWIVVDAGLFISVS